MAGLVKKSWKAKQREMVRQYRPVAITMRLSPTKAMTKKADFVKALSGTGGIKSEIAKNLGINRATVTALLERPDWLDVREAWLEECENLGDCAVKTIKDMIQQRLDFSTAAGSAKWYLSRIRREQYGDETKTVIEGGKKPLQINQLNANIPIEALDLPIEVKRQIINALDAKERAEKDKEMNPLTVPMITQQPPTEEGD